MEEDREFLIQEIEKIRNYVYYTKSINVSTYDLISEKLDEILKILGGNNG